MLKQHHNILILTLCIGIISGCGGSGDNDAAVQNDNGAPSARISDPTTSNPEARFDSEAAIRSISAGVAAQFRELSTGAQLFDTALDDYCASDVAESASMRSEAQTQFAPMMNAVQRTQLYRFGATEEDDLGVQVYSWPLSSACQIDIKLADNELDLSLAVDRRGIDALDYLLFTPENASHTCPTTITQANPQLEAFDALESSEKAARRCTMIRAITTDVVNNTNSLSNTWAVDGGNYVETFVSLPNQTQTLNLVSDALFYIEKVVKENKLDAPLGGGITNTIAVCGLGNLCPQAVESPVSRLSKQNLIANLEAFRFVFLSGSDTQGLNTGFDAWLKQVGNEALATSMLANIEAAMQILDSLPGSLYDAISADTQTISTLLNGPMQSISSQLKFEFIAAIGLRLPRGTESDTD